MFYGPKLRPQQGHCVRDDLGSSVWLRWLIGSWLQGCQNKSLRLIDTGGTTCYKPSAISSLSHKNTLCTCRPEMKHSYPHCDSHNTCTHIRHAIVALAHTRTHMLRLYKHKHASTAFFDSGTSHSCWQDSGSHKHRSPKPASSRPPSAYREESRGDRLGLLKVFLRTSKTLVGPGLHPHTNNNTTTSASEQIRAGLWDRVQSQFSEQRPREAEGGVGGLG